MSAVAVLLICLGLGQLASTRQQVWGLSLVGESRRAGYVLSGGLLLLGAMLLPPQWSVLAWTPLMSLLAVGLLLLGGSLNPPPDPHRLFSVGHPGHAHCEVVTIPDGETAMPGLLLRPAGWDESATGPAVCVIPGAGDTKTSFKWRLVEALLVANLTVLLIDPPGHGDYRQRPMTYPDCLSAIPAALRFLHTRSGVTGVSVVGISLGGALAIRSLAEDEAARARLAALVIVATPPHLNYSRALFYRELWQTLYRAPSLSLLREMSLRQTRQTWNQGGYRSRHTTAELIELLNPLAHLPTLAGVPTLLVYSRRDLVAPPVAAEAMRQAAPWAVFIEDNRASHVMIILTARINERIAGWLNRQHLPAAHQLRT